MCLSRVVHLDHVISPVCCAHTVMADGLLQGLIQQLASVVSMLVLWPAGLPTHGLGFPASVAGPSC